MHEVKARFSFCPCVTLCRVDIVRGKVIFAFILEEEDKQGAQNHASNSIVVGMKQALIIQHLYQVIIVARRFFKQL